MEIDDLYQFLSKERKVDDTIIRHLKEEGIDHSTLPLMEESDLKIYLPRKGDRLAAQQFCRSMRTKNSDSAKNSLLNRLRKKFCADEKVATSSRGSGNTNASKSKRTIEIGWLNYDESSKGYKQVRAKSGGGTRLLRVDKSSKQDEILNKALDLFFPRGMSKKGPSSNFDIGLCDFQQKEVGDSTLGELYETCSMRTMRIYLRTLKKVTTEDSEDDLPEITTKKSKKRCRDVSEASSPEAQPSPTARRKTTLLDCTPTSSEGDQAMTARTCTVTAPSTTCTATAPIESLEPIGSPTGFSFENLENLNVEEQTTVHIPIIPYSPSVSDYNYYQDSDLSFGPIETVESCCRPEEINLIQASHQSGGTESLGTLSEDPASPDEHVEPVELSVIVRRGNALLDLIRAFDDESVLDRNIKIIRTLETGEMEIGTGSGVVIDCLVEFWDEFYERCTTGLDEKVPCLRHDFREQEWKACARIYLFGWAHFKYIPVLLSSHFITSVTGQICSDVTEAFLRYVSKEENRVLRQAMTNYCSADTDDLLEVLDNHSCRKAPNSETLPMIVQEIAHKELVQEPKFIIDCWKEILQASPLGKMNPNELAELYKESIPTNKAVVQRLVINAKKPSHTETAHHLKRYLREADRVTLEEFLRFATGSNLLIHSNKVITIEFSEMSDFARRPVSRTCSQTLTLPDNYANYPDFRTEMNKVLKSEIWVFDFV